MSIRWPMLLTPTHLSQIIGTQKNLLTALQIFNQANQKYLNYRHNGPVYATKITILASSGRVNEMSDVIDQMKKDLCPCKDSVFVTAIKTYASSGMLSEDIIVYRTLLNALCDNEQVEEALEILGKILRKGLKAPTRRLLRLDLTHDDGKDIENTKRLINDAFINGVTAAAEATDSGRRWCDALRYFGEV